MNASRDIVESLSFRLGLAGAQITTAFANRVEDLGVGHKQVGAMAVIAARESCSQREIADALGVAPSLVVSLIDHLIGMRAVTRTRDVADRRVLHVELTDTGRKLLAKCASRVRELDAQLRHLTTPEAFPSLQSGVATLVGDDGMPTRIRREL